MTDYYSKGDLFMEPKIQQFGNHMVMTNVHKSIKTKHISIDTKIRDDYDYTQPANLQVVLPERVSDVHSISVTNMEIPMTFYNFYEKTQHSVYGYQYVDLQLSHVQAYD